MGKSVAEGASVKFSDVSAPSSPRRNRRTTVAAEASRLVLFLKPSTVKPRSTNGLPARAERSMTTPDAFSYELTCARAGRGHRRGGSPRG